MLRYLLSALYAAMITFAGVAGAEAKTICRPAFVDYSESCINDYGDRDQQKASIGRGGPGGGFGGDDDDDKGHGNDDDGHDDDNPGNSGKNRHDHGKGDHSAGKGKGHDRSH